MRPWEGCQEPYYYLYPRCSLIQEHSEVLRLGLLGIAFHCSCKACTKATIWRLHRDPNESSLAQGTGIHKLQYLCRPSCAGCRYPKILHMSRCGPRKLIGKKASGTCMNLPQPMHLRENAVNATVKICRVTASKEKA